MIEKEERFIDICNLVWPVMFRNRFRVWTMTPKSELALWRRALYWLHYWAQQWSMSSPPFQMCDISYLLTQWLSFREGKWTMLWYTVVTDNFCLKYTAHHRNMSDSFHNKLFGFNTRRFSIFTTKRRVFFIDFLSTPTQIQLQCLYIDYDLLPFKLCPIVVHYMFPVSLDAVCFFKELIAC
jgi:hypothetical protein